MGLPIPTSPTKCEGSSHAYHDWRLWAYWSLGRWRHWQNRDCPQVIAIEVETSELWLPSQRRNGLLLHKVLTTTTTTNSETVPAFLARHSFGKRCVGMTSQYIPWELLCMSGLSLCQIHGAGKAHFMISRLCLCLCFLLFVWSLLIRTIVHVYIFCSERLFWPGGSHWPIDGPDAPNWMNSRDSKRNRKNGGWGSKVILPRRDNLDDGLILLETRWQCVHKRCMTFP